ncbi:Gfo/Idh/MocA family protein [uncultured Friedmanniella sp.]|uniref:Gfo/Idh/MocA family protein n=1 Tax=uncultured Friedmanniella sp. TaxID=335381 RepID=UPI0035CB006B
MSSTLGVGFLGAGPVTQAIHLPTLARLTDTFHVVHISDVDADTADRVAGRVGASSSTSADAVLDDPRVDVVAICTPHRFHAAQVIAACRAGKRAVLCEKPFATSADEAAEIAAVSAETGVPIVVGAMHTFDPGWQAATAHWGSLPQNSHTIRSSIVLPPNPRFEDFATEVISPRTSPPAEARSVEAQAALAHAGIMGLAIHDLPLVRTLLPHFDDLAVLSACALAPFGYQIVLTVAGTRVELHALISKTWQPDWTLEVYSDTQALRVEFSPSYVHAGSAVATLLTAGSAQTWGPATHNGYEGEWGDLAAIVRGEKQAPDTAGLVEDLRFATAVADAAADLVRSPYREGALA